MGGLFFFLPCSVDFDMVLALGSLEGGGWKLWWWNGFLVGEPDRFGVRTGCAGYTRAVLEGWLVI